MSIRVIRGFIPFALISGLFLVSPFLASAQVEGRVFMVHQGDHLGLGQKSKSTVVFFSKGFFYNCKVVAAGSTPYQAEVKGHGRYEMVGDTIEFTEGGTSWYPQVLFDDVNRPYMVSKVFCTPITPSEPDKVVVRGVKRPWYEMDKSYRKVVKKEVKRYRSGKNFED